MIVKMKLMEDAIFGNGQSIPGEEDISLLRDENGFPYYKGSSFKGVFREYLERYLEWQGYESDKVTEELKRLLGESGSDKDVNGEMLVFSDFTVSSALKERVLKETKDPKEILDSFSSLRTFTRMNEEGIVADGSLRVARCVNQGISLYGEIRCASEDEEKILEVLSLIKWIGTMRNRGFGRIKLERVQEG